MDQGRWHWRGSQVKIFQYCRGPLRTSSPLSRFASDILHVIRTSFKDVCSFRLHCKWSQTQETISDLNYLMSKEIGADVDTKFDVCGDSPQLLPAQTWFPLQRYLHWSINKFTWTFKTLLFWKYRAYFTKA